MKRNVLSMILAVTMAGTLLAGCGSAGGQQTPAAAADTGAAASEVPADSAAAETGTAGKQTDGKNVPELTSEPLTITLWDISTEDPGKQQWKAQYSGLWRTIPILP